MSFIDRGVFITGGGSGMGWRCVELLLQAGARVAVLDLKFDQQQLERADAGDRLLAIAGDASDAATVRGAIARTVDQVGKLDLAVNAAGITGQLGPILSQADDGMDRLLAINVRGVFLAMKHEAEAMRKTGGGAIVNFASVYAKGAHENMVLYGATKHAVVGLTEGAAVEFAPHNIRVNAVAPGPIRTPFIGQITPEIETAVNSGIPQRRIGDPDEVACAVLWLLSAEASYVTGATLTIDGGQAARLAGM